MESGDLGHHKADLCQKQNSVQRQPDPKALVTELPEAGHCRPGDQRNLFPWALKAPANDHSIFSALNVIFHIFPKPMGTIHFPLDELCGDITITTYTCITLYNLEFPNAWCHFKTVKWVCWLHFTHEKTEAQVYYAHSLGTQIQAFWLLPQP